MNLVDISIIQIVEEPKKVITDELCCWEVTVVTSCYGAKKVEIFRTTSKKEIDKYKIGYTWTWMG